ncbi:MAG: hypothetical protein EB015_21480 [Methylocystaceae bacterium]|nr:hypothetical protein [Methylocystaceae bacterium]
MPLSRARKAEKEALREQKLKLKQTRKQELKASAADLITQQRVLVANAERALEEYEKSYAALGQDQYGNWFGPNSNELNAEWCRLRHIVKVQRKKLTDLNNRYGSPSAITTAGNLERQQARATQVNVGTGLIAYGHMKLVGEDGYLHTLSGEGLTKAASVLLGVLLTTEQMELFAFLKTSQFCTDCKLNKFCFLCRLERSMQGNARPELEICFMFDRETGKATKIGTLFSPANCSCRSQGCIDSCRTCDKYEYEQTHCSCASAIDHSEHDCDACREKKNAFDCSRTANNVRHFEMTWQDPVHPDILGILRDVRITKRCKALFETPNYFSYRSIAKQVREADERARELKRLKGLQRA